MPGKIMNDMIEQLGPLAVLAGPGKARNVRRA
jgi:hypothetical protein